MAEKDVRTFLGALQSFNQSIKQLQVQRSIQAANEQVQQIRQAEFDEAQQNEALRQVGQNLSFNLAEADPQFAVQALKSLQPQPATQIEVQEQAQGARLEFQQKQHVFQEERQEKQIASQERVAAIRFEAAKEQNIVRQTSKLNRERRKAQSDASKEFNRFSKDIRRAQIQAKNAIKLIDSGSPLTAATVRVLLARASGEVGNLSATEQEAFSGREDIISRINRSFQLGTISQLPEGDKQALKEIAQLYIGTQGELEREFAQQLTNQTKANELFAEIPLNTLISNITGGRIQRFEEASQSIDSGAPQTRDNRRFLRPIEQVIPQAPPPIVESEQRRRKFLTPLGKSKFRDVGE